MILFRVDASQEIGAGHVMRCLALADAFVSCGHVCRFVCRYLPEYLVLKLQASGHQVVILPAVECSELDDLSHASWLGTSQRIDAEATISAVSDIQCEWIVVDHYALDKRWESLLRPYTSHIMVIDDLVDRDHDCDVLLDQNLHNQTFDGYATRVPAHCQLLLGPKFAILRDEFSMQRSVVQARSGRVRRIMVYFGGFDCFNLTTLAVQALIRVLRENKHANLIVDVVIGKAHQYADSIRELCQQGNFNLHTQVDNMAELFALADISIGAGGISTWERCCVGLPTIALCAADNQKSQLVNAALHGLIYAPEIGIDKISSLCIHITSCFENPLLLKNISIKAMQAVDGRGVSRVVKKLGLPLLTLRLAQLTDSEHIHQWRNLEHVRKFSHDPQPISYDAHQKWYATTMASSDRKLLIGESQGVPIGVVRFDLHQQTALISIYLIADNSSAVSGGQLLQYAEQWLVENYSEIRFVYADVLGENLASVGMFTSAGYKLKAQSYEKRLLHHV